MRSSLIAAGLGATLANAIYLPANLQSGVDWLQGNQQPLAEVEKFLIELAPGETRLVTEDEKWQLRREGKSFFVITGLPERDASINSQATVKYPK